MRLRVIVGIIIGLIILALIGWAVYRFLHPKKEIEQPEVNDKDENNPPVNNETKQEPEKQVTNPNIVSDPEQEEKNKNKWKEFKFSKKANITKINNDIAIDEANKFSNPDFEELFKQPVEINKSLFKQDVTDNKLDMSAVRSRSYELYMNNDTSTTANEEFVDINELDNVENFSNSFQNIEKTLTPNQSNEQPIPTVKLIDNEVFGY